jgi:hypothetical protein
MISRCSSISSSFAIKSAFSYRGYNGGHFKVQYSKARPAEPYRTICKSEKPTQMLHVGYS